MSCCFEHREHEAVVMRGFEWLKQGGERPAGNLERLGVVIDGVPGWHPIDRVCTPGAATLVAPLSGDAPAKPPVADPVRAALVDVIDWRNTYATDLGGERMVAELSAHRAALTARRE